MKPHTFYRTFLMVSVASMGLVGCLDTIYAEEEQKIRDKSKAEEGLTLSVEVVEERKNSGRLLSARQEKKEKFEGMVSESKETEKKKKEYYLTPTFFYEPYNPPDRMKSLPEGFTFGKQWAGFLDLYPLRTKPGAMEEDLDGNSKLMQTGAFQASGRPVGNPEDAIERAPEKYKLRQKLIDYWYSWVDPVAKPYTPVAFIQPYFESSPFFIHNSWYVDYTATFASGRGVPQYANTDLQEGSKERGSSIADSDLINDNPVNDEPVVDFNSPGSGSDPEIPESVPYSMEDTVDLDPSPLKPDPVHLQPQVQDLGGIK